MYERGTIYAVEPDDEEAIEAMCATLGMWGTNFVKLSPEFVEALQSGKAIVFGDGEYTTVISIGDEA